MDVGACPVLLSVCMVRCESLQRISDHRSGFLCSSRVQHLPFSLFSLMLNIRTRMTKEIPCSGNRHRTIFRIHGQLRPSDHWSIPPWNSRGDWEDKRTLGLGWLWNSETVAVLGDRVPSEEWQWTSNYIEGRQRKGTGVYFHLWWGGESGRYTKWWILSKLSWNRSI